MMIAAQRCAEGEALIGSMVVGTDGSETAGEAVRQATELAQQLGAKVHVVSAYEPVPEGRLREERQQVPEDLENTSHGVPRPPWRGTGAR